MGEILNLGTWIVIYMPILLLFFVILPQAENTKKILFINNKKIREGLKMDNQFLKNYEGCNCSILTGSFGSNVSGKIIQVSENWLQLETKKGIVLMNSEYIQSIFIKK